MLLELKSVEDENKKNQESKVQCINNQTYKLLCINKS